MSFGPTTAASRAVVKQYHRKHLLIQYNIRVSINTDPIVVTMDIPVINKHKKNSVNSDTKIQTQAW